MKIAKFSAEKVNGYLNFDISFRDDYTFLIGLNGSGKTTVLRLIMALVTPDVPSVAEMDFSKATVTVLDGESQRNITVQRSLDELVLKVDGVDDSLVLSAAELTLLREPKQRDEAESPVLTRANESNVVTFIRRIGTPMFLGLDRRFSGDVSLRDPAEARRREFFYRRTMEEHAGLVRGHVAAALSDVNLLVYETMGDVRQRQEELDAEFRNRLLVSVFSYKPADIREMEVPSRAAIGQYREKQSDIEYAVKNLQLPLQDVRTALDDFFERMNQIASDLEHAVPSPTKGLAEERGGEGKRSRQYGAHRPPAKAPDVPSDKIVEWIVNKPQVDRITAHLELLATYNDRRTALREPIERFLRLLNSFLGDTGKRITVNEKGGLRVERSSGEPMSIAALSSGERQLLVMLGQLTLNKQLAGSSVFIVDEPELSLHISWQERFVNAVREANAGMQLIMATHSPAIILNRDENCESLDSVS